MGRVTNALGWVAAHPAVVAAARSRRPTRSSAGCGRPSRGEREECYAITEEGAGSDVDDIVATARRDGDDYVLDGVKWHVTSYNSADYAFFQAKLVDGPNAGRARDVLRRPAQRRGQGRAHPGVLPHASATTTRSWRSRRPRAGGQPGRRRGRRHALRLRVVPVRADDGRRPVPRRGASGWSRRRPRSRSNGSCGASRSPSSAAVQAMLADSLTELFAARSMVYETARGVDDGVDVKVAARPVLDGQAVRLGDGRPGRRPRGAGLRRPRLHARERRRAVLPRAAGRADLGGHQRDPARRSSPTRCASAAPPPSRDEPRGYVTSARGLKPVPPCWPWFARSPRRGSRRCRGQSRPDRPMSWRPAFGQGTLQVVHDSAGEQDSNEHRDNDQDQSHGAAPRDHLHCTSGNWPCRGPGLRRCARAITHNHACSQDRAGGRDFPGPGGRARAGGQGQGRGAGPGPGGRARAGGQGQGRGAGPGPGGRARGRGAGPGPGGRARAAIRFGLARGVFLPWPCPPALALPPGTWPCPPALALPPGPGPAPRPWPCPPALALPPGPGPAPGPWPCPPALALPLPPARSWLRTSMMRDRPGTSEKSRAATGPVARRTVKMVPGGGAMNPHPGLVAVFIALLLACGVVYDLKRRGLNAGRHDMGLSGRDCPRHRRLPRRGERGKPGPARRNWLLAPSAGHVTPRLVARERRGCA